jgi:hypothetical protein
MIGTKMGLFLEGLEKRGLWFGLGGVGVADVLGKTFAVVDLDVALLTK